MVVGWFLRLVHGTFAMVPHEYIEKAFAKGECTNVGIYTYEGECYWNQTDYWFLT